MLCVSSAVRTGNLAKFNQVLEQFGEKFQTDGTYTLIIRLRHNVIKTGEMSHVTVLMVEDVELSSVLLSLKSVY